MPLPIVNLNKLFRRFSFERQILSYFVAVVLIIGSIVWLSSRISRRADVTREWIAQMQHMLARTDSLADQQKDLVLAVQGYLITGDPAWLPHYTRLDTAIGGGLGRLEKEVHDNPAQQMRLDTLLSLHSVHRALRQEQVALARAEVSPQQARQLVRRADSVFSRLQAVMNTLKSSEEQLLAQRRADYRQSLERSARVVRVLLGVFVGSLLLAFILAYLNTRKRNRAEAALRKSEGLISSIIEHAPVLINVKDLQGRFLLANRPAAYALGTEPEALVGRTNEAFLAPATAAALRREEEEVARTGQPSEMEVRLPGPGGEQSYITSKFPLYDGKGRLYAVGSTSADITPIKRAHEALHRQYEQQQRILNGLQSVLSTSSDMICIVNEACEFVMVSDTARQLLGYAPKELMSKRFIDFVAEEDRERTKTIAQEIIAGYPVTDFTNRYRRSDGELVPVIWSAKWLAEDRLMYCIARNGAERVKVAEQLAQSQARLAHAQTIARMGNWEWDLENNVWSCSDEIYTLLGVRKEEGIRVQGSLLAAIHPEDREALNAAREAALTQGKKVDVEHRILHPDGQVYYMHTKGEVTVDKTGKPVWFSGTLQDITERKKSELTLRQLYGDLQKKAEELRASNAELERFAYVASHDLQEPLRMVSSFLALLHKKLDGQLDDTTQNFIRFAVDGAERMKTLIRDLLHYSRLGTQKEPPAPVDLNEVRESVAQTFAAELEAGGGVLTATSLPVVMGNRSQLTQLLQNLVGNALKYRGDAPPVIHISGTEEKDRYTFCVQDNGIGIDPKFFDKIFIIFQRLHGKTEYPGTGIGLAICKKIVERHGGTIWVDSRPGAGSRFYFTLKKRQHG